MTDIDIDFADRQQILIIIPHVPASIIKNSDVKKHLTGIYVQEIPVNPLTGTASFDYKEAENRGYFKLDFLNVSVYSEIRDETHLNKLMEREPLWELLEQKEFVDLLFHLNGHSQVLKIMKPKNIEQLAICLALIRPAKRHLLGKSWDQLRQEIWKPDPNGNYGFKKSHAISYAHLVVVHMNLICEQMENLSNL